jgi:hypothetical protein
MCTFKYMYFDKYRMNPWEQDEEKRASKKEKNEKNEKNSAIIETFELIKNFEKERKDRNVASYRRNDAYWMELKKIHGESLSDLREFLEYLHYKKDYYRKHGICFFTYIYVLIHVCTCIYICIYVNIYI